MTGNIAKTRKYSQVHSLPTLLILVILGGGLVNTGCKAHPRRLFKTAVSKVPVSLDRSAEAASPSGTPVSGLHVATFRVENGADADSGTNASGTNAGLAAIDHRVLESGAQDNILAHLLESSVNVPIVVAEQVVEPEVDLESLIVQTLSVHPRIQAARQRVAALNHRIPQVTALEDPIVGNTFWPIQDQALQTAGGRVGHQFSVAQKIPWPEKLKARGVIAQREVQMANAEVLKAEREIVEAVRLAYYELWLADQLILIVDENKELVGDLITIAGARYKTGGSQQDILRAEMEADKLDEQLINLRRNKEQARADLGTLVRQPIHLVPTAVKDLDVSDAVPDLESLIVEAEQCNPELQGLAAEVARDRAKQKLACLQQYPDFQLGIGYSIISDDQNVISPVANGHDNINLAIGVSLPIWRNRINGGMSEATHHRNSTIHLREAERDRLRGQLRRQVADAYASTEQLELFRDRLIPKTEQALKIATADYQGRKVDFADLIETYRELLSYQVQVARAQARLATVMARIERIVGCPHL